jgi:hypothetical protein
VLCKVEQIRNNALIAWFEVLCALENCDRKLSRQIWSTMWSRSDNIGWGHDTIWVDIGIGTDDIRCCHDQILCAIWIVKDVEWSFNDKFDIIYALQKIWKNAIMTQYEMFCGLVLMWKNGCYRKLSWPILSTMWIRRDERGWCYDLICGALELEGMWKNYVMT